MTIGRNIKSLRERKGMTQYELAEKVGVTQAQICMCEKGSNTPSLRLCIKLAAALSCSLNDIVDSGRRAV